MPAIFLRFVCPQKTEEEEGKVFVLGIGVDYIETHTEDEIRVVGADAWFVQCICLPLLPVHFDKVPNNPRQFPHGWPDTNQMGMN